MTVWNTVKNTLNTYLPTKEVAAKILATTAVGAGAAVAGYGSLKGKQGFANAGALASLMGNLLDDVPRAWVMDRAHKTYGHLLELVRPSVEHSLFTGDAYLQNFDATNAHDISNPAKCARIIQYFNNNVVSYEIARVEHFPDIIKALFSATAFGISAARDAGTGGFGAGGILVGCLIGGIVCACTLRPGHRGEAAPTSANIRDYANPINAANWNPEPNYSAVGDYKGAISILKFCASATAAAGCLLGLSVSQTRAHSSFHSYLNDHFLSTMTNAVSAGAAIGALLPTAVHRVASGIHNRRLILSNVFRDQQQATRLNQIQNPHTDSRLNTFHRGAERFCFGVIV